MKYLKSQINPHFLFNTLNNIYGLAIEKSDKVPGLILQLSDLLSYSLYESTQQKLPIAKEMKLIQDYVAIEKERYGERVTVNWQIEETAILEREMAPLLFFPLVENAFKHGVKEEMGGAKVDITLNRAGKHVFFEVKNTIPRDYQEPKHKKEGIGLSNVKRRLNLLYPEKHLLDIKKQAHSFKVSLTIDI